MGNDLPLLKNNGRYGELGHWGKRSGRRFTKKKILLLGTLLSLSLIFAISHNGNILPIVNAGDYNTTYSHTRTLIFGDNLFNGPSGHAGGAIVFNSKVNGSLSGMSTSLPALTVSSGDTIVLTMIGANAFDFGCSVASAIAISDTQTNSYTLRVQSPDVVGGGANTCIYTAPAGSTGSDTITISTAPHNEIWQSITAMDYSGAIGIGVSGTEERTVNPTDSSTINLTVGSTGSVIIEAFELQLPGGTVVVTETSGQTIRNSATPTTNPMLTTDVSGLSGATSVKVSWVITPGPCTTPNFCRLSHSALELTFSPLVFSQVRWNFNSTCVNMRGPSPREVDFDWSKGTAGSGGANCNSANIMISKSQVNFQTAAGRDLEIVWMAASLNTSNTQSIDLVFRTNSTLPSFTENYNPFNDTNARLIYEACTRFSTSCGGSGQTVYIQHDPNKNIFTETRANDFVVSGAVPDFKNNAPVWFQAVLNFTGPNNYINEQTSVSTTNNSNNTASALQMGQSYNILIKVNTIGSPSGVSAAEVTNTFGAGPNGIPAPLSIWSVPPSCADPVNKAACGLGTPQPVFQFNPLDPSSWGNAIIQGLVWVFSVALPTGLVIIAGVLLQVIQITFNFIGNHLGWGNIGDNIVTFVNSLPSLFGQIGAVLGNLANIVSSVIQTIIIANLLANPYFAGLVNVLSDFKNAIGSGIVISLLNQIAFWFPTSYMIILISTYFLFVFLKGLHGFFDWLHLVKWSSFQLVGLFSLFIDVFVSLITAILGRLSIISPGHKFPRIPHPNPGSLPKIQLGGEIAFFDDPTAWFLAFTGLIFTMMWAGTSSAGLPANTQTVIQSFSGLFLTLFGAGFMVLILYIPGFLLGKLYQKGIIS
jgi:hypothetical protein